MRLARARAMLKLEIEVLFWLGFSGFFFNEIDTLFFELNINVT